MRRSAYSPSLRYVEEIGSGPATLGFDNLILTPTRVQNHAETEHKEDNVQIYKKMYDFTLKVYKITTYEQNYKRVDKLKRRWTNRNEGGKIEIKVEKLKRWKK